LRGWAVIRNWITNHSDAIATAAGAGWTPNVTTSRIVLQRSCICYHTDTNNPSQSTHHGRRGFLFTVGQKPGRRGNYIRRSHGRTYAIIGELFCGGTRFKIQQLAQSLANDQSLTHMQITHHQSSLIQTISGPHTRLQPVGS